MSKKIFSLALSGLFFIVLGIFMMIKPTYILKIAIIAFVLFNLSEGVINLYHSIKKKGYVKTNIIKSVINIIICAVVFFFILTMEGSTVSSWIIYLIALNLFLSGTVELFEFYQLKKKGLSLFSPFPFVSIILALLMVLFPLVINNLIMTIISIICIFIGIFSIIMLIFEIKKNKGNNTVIIEEDEITEINEK